MTRRAVIRMGHPTLRKVADQVSVSEIKSAEFKTLLQDMFDTMKAEGGIGIAAPQINVSKQVCLIELPQNSERYGTLSSSPLFTIINPVISYLTEDEQGFWEGCLSVPGLRGYVERPKKIKVQYLDENAQAQEIIAEDFLATVFQHELDHLFGKLYVDRIKDMTKLSYNEEFSQFMGVSPSESLDD